MIPLPEPDNWPSYSDDQMRAYAAAHVAEEAAALQAEIDALRADLKKHKAHILMVNDIITNQCIAMQSALIDQHHNGHEAGMAWIGNTLFGPGLIPDIDEALALSKTNPAQAWFDAKMAEHEAMRAKQDAADAIRAGGDA
jgi:hypothetical protein